MIKVYEQFINNESKRISGTGFETFKNQSVEVEKRNFIRLYQEDNQEVKVVYEIPNVLCILVAAESTDNHKYIVISELTGVDE